MLGGRLQGECPRTETMCDMCYVPGDVFAVWHTPWAVCPTLLTRELLKTADVSPLTVDFEFGQKFTIVSR